MCRLHFQFSIRKNCKVSSVKKKTLSVLNYFAVALFKLICLDYIFLSGCQTKMWGSNCSISCAENCIEQHCYPGNGSCIFGCRDNHCLKSICSRDTAVCTEGCIKERAGPYCNKCK